MNTQKTKYQEMRKATGRLDSIITDVVQGIELLQDHSLSPVNATFTAYQSELKNRVDRIAP